MQIASIAVSFAVDKGAIPFPTTMNVVKFLKEYIHDDSDYNLEKNEEKTILHQGLVSFIFDKLNSSKYRASKTESGYKQKIVDKIRLSVDHQIPIHITLPFGATKNPYLKTAPQVDWAEVFNIAYIRNYLKPIAAAYNKGVILEYISVAVFEKEVNYIPVTDTDLYDKQFSQLIAYFQNYLPKNYKLKYSRVGDIINRNEIERMLKIKKKYLSESWNKQDKKVIENKLFRAERNCIIKKGNKNKDKLLLQSALGHDAFCSEYWTTEATPWDKKHMITLGHNYTNGWAIHVRSTPGSSVNFWSGIGVLRQNRNKLTPTVLSPKQYGAVKTKIQTEPVDIFSDKLPNLQNIEII